MSAGSPSSGSHSHRCGREWILLTCPPTCWTLIARRRRRREGRGCGQLELGVQTMGKFITDLRDLACFFLFAPQTLATSFTTLYPRCRQPFPRLCPPLSVFCSFITCSQRPSRSSAFTLILLATNCSFSLHFLRYFERL